MVFTLMNGITLVIQCDIIEPLSRTAQYLYVDSNFLFRDYVHISFLDEKGETINSLLNCFDGHRFLYLVNVMIAKSKLDQEPSINLVPMMIRTEERNDDDDEMNANGQIV